MIECKTPREEQVWAQAYAYAMVSIVYETATGTRRKLRTLGVTTYERSDLICDAVVISNGRDSAREAEFIADNAIYELRKITEQ